MMELHKSFSAYPISPVALVVASALLVSGCLDSGGSDAGGPVTGETATGGPATSAPVTSGPSTSQPIVSDAPSTDVTSEDGEDETTDTGPVVVDPLIQNKILVSFEMTVPFYLSDELRVELVWGDIKLDAMWVGGQSWSASGEFPTETENPLVITFYDNNGFDELAQYSENYKTASNVSEAVQIQAEQFDATLFDDDRDGVNNLDELNAGTDPFTDEDSLLEIRDFYEISKWSRMSVSESFESRLSDSRPYIGTFNSDPDWQSNRAFGVPDPLVVGDINIDADGNGTLAMQAGVVDTTPQIRFTGTRTHSGSSISWTGVRQAWDGDYYHENNVTNTVSVVDENVRNFVQEDTGRNNGTFEFTWEASTNLTGSLIEGTSLCKPVAGTHTSTHRTAGAFDEIEFIETTTISKEIDDPYWRVVEVEEDFLFPGTKTSEFFVRDLRMIERSDAPDSANFICDFVDV